MRQIHLGQMARIATLFAAPLLLSSCLLFFRSPKLPKLPEEKYDVNEDSTFFSKMPPYSEEGKDIVAFEIDGKPYVYPKAGAFLGFIDMPSEWRCELRESDSRDSLCLSFHVSRIGKKYNATGYRFSVDFPSKEFEQLSHSLLQPYMRLWGNPLTGNWSAKRGEEVRLKLAKLDSEKRIISGTFEGVLKNSHTPTKTIEIQNGFFDLVYIDKRDQ